MRELTDKEKSDLLSHYQSYDVDEQEIVQADWVTRKFPSTGALMRCVVRDGAVIIKQLPEFSELTERSTISEYTACFKDTSNNTTVCKQYTASTADAALDAATFEFQMMELQWLDEGPCVDTRLDQFLKYGKFFKNDVELGVFLARRKEADARGAISIDTATDLTNLFSKL